MPRGRIGSCRRGPARALAARASCASSRIEAASSDRYAELVEAAIAAATSRRSPTSSAGGRRRPRRGLREADRGGASTARRRGDPRAETGKQSRDRRQVVVVLIVIGLVVLLGLIYILIRNSMIGARNRVDEAWCGIDVQLKRRHDLVPNLVETVKGYAPARARDVRGDNEGARRRDGGAGRRPDARRRGKLTAALADLRAVAENYPQLRATENFQRLQASLTRDRGRDPGLAPDLQLERPVLQHEDPGLPELGHRQLRAASPRASSSRSRPPPTASRSRSPSRSPPPAGSPRAARAAAQPAQAYPRA